MNIEGPHRELPKDNSIFDEKKHEKTVHKKGKEAWITKDAAISDKEAQIITEKREAVEEKKHSWLGNIFRKKGEYTDILTEKALIEHLGDLQITTAPIKNGMFQYNLSGNFNQHKLKILFDTSLPYGETYYHIHGYVDDHKLNSGYLNEILKKIVPLIRQRDANTAMIEQMGPETKLNISDEERIVLEVLGRLPPKKTSELEGKNEPKQLGPKKEE